MKSITFTMGNQPGQKVPGAVINDSAFGEGSKVHFLIVDNVPNNNTFVHTPNNMEINAGNAAGFPQGAMVTILYTPASCN